MKVLVILLVALFLAPMVVLAGQVVNSSKFDLADATQPGFSREMDHATRGYSPQTHVAVARGGADPTLWKESTLKKYGWTQEQAQSSVARKRQGAGASFAIRQGYPVLDGGLLLGWERRCQLEFFSVDKLDSLLQHYPMISRGVAPVQPAPVPVVSRVDTLYVFHRDATVESRLDRLELMVNSLSRQLDLAFAGEVRQPVRATTMQSTTAPISRPKASVSVVGLASENLSLAGGKVKLPLGSFTVTVMGGAIWTQAYSLSPGSVQFEMRNLGGNRLGYSSQYLSPVLEYESKRSAFIVGEFGKSFNCPDLFGWLKN